MGRYKSVGFTQELNQLIESYRFELLPYQIVGLLETAKHSILFSQARELVGDKKEKEDD